MYWRIARALGASLDALVTRFSVKNAAGAVTAAASGAVGESIEKYGPRVHEEWCLQDLNRDLRRTDPPPATNRAAASSA